MDYDRYLEPSCSSDCSKALTGSPVFAPEPANPTKCYLQFSPPWAGGQPYTDEWCKKQMCGKNNCEDCMHWAGDVAKCNDDDLHFWCAQCSLKPPPAPPPSSSGKCCAKSPSQQVWCDQQKQDKNDCNTFTLLGPDGHTRYNPCLWHTGNSCQGDGLAENYKPYCNAIPTDPYYRLENTSHKGCDEVYFDNEEDMLVGCSAYSHSPFYWFKHNCKNGKKETRKNGETRYHCESGDHCQDR